MKKITYLVAPLMVLPFLVGCNKGTNYKVSVADASDKHLKFVSEAGKDLKDVKAEKGKDFVFKVEAVQENEDTEEYRVNKDCVFVAVGGNVLYDGVSIKYGGADESDQSYATVTVAKEKITADIVVGGIAGKKGYYVYYIPYSLGIETTMDPYGYLQCGTQTVIPFNGDITAAVYSIDGKEWDFAGAAQSQTPVHITDQKKQLAINPTYGDIKDSLIIMARGGNDGWLESFGWDDIKTVSEMGAARVLFEVGDKKSITINDQKHEVEIIGFNHDYTEKGEGEERAKAGITFKFNTLLSDANGNAIPAVWGESHQDFEKASLNEYLNKDVFGMLPDELKDEGVIKTVYKPVGVWNSDDEKWEIKEYPTQLFPLSAVEAGFTATYDVDGEGKKYEYDEIHLSLTDAKGAYHNYWLRSPNTETDWRGYTHNYSYVIQNSKGSTPSLGRLAATSSRYVVPCFCI